jgi:hypothetical protein
MIRFDLDKPIAPEWSRMTGMERREKTEAQVVREKKSLRREHMK